MKMDFFYLRSVANSRAQTKFNQEGVICPSNRMNNEFSRRNKG